MASQYLVPIAGTIAALGNKTFDAGFTNLLIKNSTGSSGNVTVAFFRDGVATGETYIIEPGETRTWYAAGVMFDKFTATCAASTTAQYEYLN